MTQYDIETRSMLMPVYICLTRSKASYNERTTDFDSNAVTSRINISTFGKCWMDVFFNKERGLEDKYQIPEEDSKSKRGIYMVWSVTKAPQSHYGEVSFDSPTLNRTFIGLINEEFLKKHLPKTARDLERQAYYFSLDKD